jgi:hypothetical protein
MLAQLSQESLLEKSLLETFIFVSDVHKNRFERFLVNIGHLAYDLGQLDSLPACHRSIAKTLRKDKRITAFLDQERDNKIKFFPF